MWQTVLVDSGGWVTRSIHTISYTPFSSKVNVLSSALVFFWSGHAFTVSTCCMSVLASFHNYCYRVTEVGVSGKYVFLRLKQRTLSISSVIVTLVPFLKFARFCKVFLSFQGFKMMRVRANFRNIDMNVLVSVQFKILFMHALLAATKRLNGLLIHLYI